MPDVIYAPPHQEAATIVPIPVPTDATARAFVDNLNQSFGELVRVQKANADAIGADLSQLNEATRSVNAALENAAGEVARMDAALASMQAAAIERTVASAGGEDAADFRNSPDWANAADYWMRFGGAEMSDEHKNVLAKGNHYQKVVSEATAIARAAPGWSPQNAVSQGGLSTAFGPGAGVWARPTYDKEITKLLVEHSPIRSFARVTNINSGEFIGVIRTANRDIIEPAIEGATGTQQTQKDRYDERKVRVYKFLAKPGLTTEMIEDSVIDLESEVKADVGRDFAVDESLLFTVGSGAGEPHGYATDPDVLGVETQASGLIAQKDLLDLALSLRPDYRMKGAYAFSTEAFRAAILHEDGLGRRLWQPSHQEGMPSLYQGWKYFESVQQAAVVASAKPVFFADWNSFYRIIDRRGIQIIRDEITVDNVVILKHSRRYGGRTWKTEAGKALTVKA